MLQLQANRLAKRIDSILISGNIFDMTLDVLCESHMPQLFFELKLHLETPESLDMVYTWYILGIYFQPL